MAAALAWGGRRAGGGGDLWAQAVADGAFEERWSDATRTLATAPAPTFVQIAHEMNGDWMSW